MSDDQIYNEENTGKAKQQEYISGIHYDESAERILYTYANIVKVICFIIGALCILAGLIFMFRFHNYGPAFICIFSGLIPMFMGIVNYAFIKVFSNISTSLKDITKIVNHIDEKK